MIKYEIKNFEALNVKNFKKELHLKKLKLNMYI